MRKPSTYFLIAAVMLFISGLFLANHGLDINVHDTYYVIGWREISFSLGALLLLIGGILFLKKK